MHHILGTATHLYQFCLYQLHFKSGLKPWTRVKCFNNRKLTEEMIPNVSSPPEVLLKRALLKRAMKRPVLRQAKSAPAGVPMQQPQMLLQAGQVVMATGCPLPVSRYAGTPLIVSEPRCKTARGKVAR